MKKHMIKKSLLLALSCILFQCVFSQTEVAPWGNITGIRTDGQLMKFETRLALVKKGWTGITATGKEKQKPAYMRKGDQQIVATSVDSLNFTQVVEETGKGVARVTVQFTARADMLLEGVYFCLSLPQADYGNGTIRINRREPVTLADQANNNVIYKSYACYYAK